MPTRFMGQDPVFKEDGRMRPIFLQVDTLVTTKVKYSIGEIEFKRIDSASFGTKNPFRDILLEWYNTRKDNSIEIFYLFNGTDSSIGLHTHGRSLIAVAYAQAANGALKPISFHIRPSCGIGCSELVVKKGDLLILRNDFTQQKGGFKTRGQFRILTLSEEKIFSSYFSTSIDSNSFYLDPQYEKEFLVMKKNITFLN